MAEALAPFLIDCLQLQGFRAYLEPKTLKFGQKRNLAVFGSNASGKSSLVDALEFLFSDNATLERIGVKAVNNSAGPGAIPHNLAAQRNIAPQVSVTFKQKGISVEATRNASGPNRDRPKGATTVKACFAVDPIIRGYALRRFVEDQKAEERYAEVASWLQLTPLVDVQKNLRLLRQQVKASAEDTAALKRIDTQLAVETGDAVAGWDTHTVIDHINHALLKPLAADLELTELSAKDPIFATVEARAKDEEERLGLPGLRQIAAAAAALFTETSTPKTGKLVATGAIPEFDTAAAALTKAQQREAEERAKAASAVFAEVWKAAAPLFAEAAVAPETCPVCDTPIAQTSARSATGVREHIAAHLAELESYAQAKKALDDARRGATVAQQRLLAQLQALQPLLPDTNAHLREALAGYAKLAGAWSEGPALDSAKLCADLRVCQTTVAAAIEAIEKRQGDHTFVKALTKVQRFLGLHRDYELAKQTQSELGKLSAALNDQAAFVSAEIRKKVQALLDGLRTAANEIYQQIQGQKAMPIRLELPPEDDVNQQRLHLLIDFAPNREGVQPGGYLSDSQIHSLALALRLAAIKRFNRGAPIIVLDDIVTSYDADHRRSIAAMLANLFTDFQVILTTHDERFFLYLKDQLAEKDWQYLRITRLDPDFGPRFAEHRVTDQMIERRWADGESAANEMRQAEEEWLLARCREFGVDIRIRSVDGAHTYDRGELADAMQAYLKRIGLEPPLVPGVNNRFLKSLQKGVIENFGSHFQDAQYGAGSIGDEQARWSEFKHFRDQFVCPKCKRQRFARPFQLKRPICAQDECQAQFEFSALAVEVKASARARSDARSA